MFVAVTHLGAGICEGRGCDALGPLTLVVHEARWLRDPEARNAEAALCPACVGKLAGKIRPIEPCPEPSREPFVWRGKTQPSF